MVVAVRRLARSAAVTNNIRFSTIEEQSDPHNYAFPIVNPPLDRHSWVHRDAHNQQQVRGSR